MLDRLFAWVAPVALTVGILSAPVLIAQTLAAETASSATGTKSAPLKIVAFGDSLVAGYGVTDADAFPSQLQRALVAKGLNVEVLNSGVSGDTTASGLARFDWAVPEDADAVILELGANDGLRGLSPADAKANLEKILKRISERKIPVLLAGMRAPANWGPDYKSAFDAMYEDLAATHGALLYPFFLDGVVGSVKLNQDDRLHPNSSGVAVIVERMLPMVEQLIAASKAD